MAKKKPPTPETPTPPAPLGFPQFEGLGLNLKQQAFVVAYVRPEVGFNATRAYMEAYGDTVDDALVAAAAASRLLRNVNVQRAVTIEISRLTQNHSKLAQAVLDSWAVTAFADWTEVLSVQGPFVYLRSVDEIPPHLKSQITSIENTQSGIRVKLCDRDKAKENIAMALGMFVEVKQTVGDDYESLVHKLAKEEEGQKNET